MFYKSVAQSHSLSIKYDILSLYQFLKQMYTQILKRKIIIISLFVWIISVLTSNIFKFIFFYFFLDESFYFACDLGHSLATLNFTFYPNLNKIDNDNFGEICSFMKAQSRVFLVFYQQTLTNIIEEMITPTVVWCLYKPITILVNLIKMLFIMANFNI